jgi:biotin carboxyl carrier protein
MDSEKENKEEKQEFQKFLLEGDTYKTLLTKKWLARKPYVLNDPNKIISFIPGTIIKVFVKVGQKVKKGDNLLVLEAMKMNNLLLAPSNGVVSKLHVVAGAKVANKQILVEIETEGVTEPKKKKEKVKKRRK